MKFSRLLFSVFLLVSSMTFAQAEKWVFINGKYHPYRASGRYEINGETIFYKNERTYDRIPENLPKEQLDPYGRPIAGPPVKRADQRAAMDRIKSLKSVPIGTVNTVFQPSVTITMPPQPAMPQPPQGEKPLAEPSRSY